MFDHSDWKVKFRYKMLFKLQLFSFQKYECSSVIWGESETAPRNFISFSGASRLSISVSVSLSSRFLFQTSTIHYRISDCISKLTFYFSNLWGSSGRPNWCSITCLCWIHPVEICCSSVIIWHCWLVTLRYWIIYVSSNPIYSFLHCLKLTESIQRGIIIDLGYYV